MPDKQHLYLNADPNKFAQVIRNLVSNALKFTSSNGTVKVSATVQHKSKHQTNEDSSNIMSNLFRKTTFRRPSTHMYENEHEDFLVLTVTDSGAGISKVKSWLYSS